MAAIICIPSIIRAVLAAFVVAFAGLNGGFLFCVDVARI